MLITLILWSLPGLLGSFLFHYWLKRSYPRPTTYGDVASFLLFSLGGPITLLVLILHILGILVEKIAKLDFWEKDL